MFGGQIAGVANGNPNPCFLLGNKHRECVCLASLYLFI